MPFVEIILIIFVPFIILKFRNNPIIKRIGVAGAAYLAGLLFAVCASALISLGVLPERDTTACEILAYVGISLAIPLLLFSGNIRHILKLSKKTLLAFLLLIISVFAVTTALFLLYTHNISHGEVLSGMAAALYTGGTPNLNAVACIFHLDSELILAANISDILFGGVFYVFLLFAAKPLLSKFLKSPEPVQSAVNASLSDEDISMSFSLRSRGVIFSLLLSLLIALLSLGVGAAIWLAKGQEDGTLTNYAVPALMIGATVGGVALSFSPKVNSVRENDLSGKYFVVLFSYAIASMVDLGKCSTLSLEIFAMYAIITTASFFFHVLLCKIFHIGADTMIVTSSAGIYGPAFIPSITKAIHAEYLLAAGLITGSFGYAIGTFLGIACTYFLTVIL